MTIYIPPYVWMPIAVLGLIASAIFARKMLARHLERDNVKRTDKFCPHCGNKIKNG